MFQPGRPEVQDDDDTGGDHCTLYVTLGDRPTRPVTCKGCEGTQASDDDTIVVVWKLPMINGRLAFGEAGHSKVLGDSLFGQGRNPAWPPLQRRAVQNSDQAILCSGGLVGEREDEMEEDFGGGGGPCLVIISEHIASGMRPAWPEAGNRGASSRS